LALVVVTEPLLATVPDPAAPTATSSGLVVLSPLYSRIGMSASGTLPLKFTVTVLAPAAAMFFA
jgi:hypothetical protein